MLSFDMTKLERLGKVYDLDMQIKVVREEECSSKDYVADMTDVGHDRHLNEPDNIINQSDNIASCDHSERENAPQMTSADKENDLTDLTHPSHPTLASDMTKEEQREAYEKGHVESLRKSRAAQG